MIGDQLGDESKAKPASLWLAGDERLEQMIDDIGGRARSGIDHAHLDRERQPPPVRSGHAIAVAISGGDGNLVPAARQADSFGRVLQQVEEYLDQPVAAAADLGKGSEEHTSELQSLMRNSYAV